MQKEWSEKEIKFLIENYEKMSYREIGEILKRTKASVQAKASKIGIKHEKKYKFNSDFFKSPLNERSAYWIGFIAADGYVSKGKSGGNCIGIELKSTDYKHLKKFNKDIEGNIPVVFRVREQVSFGKKIIQNAKQCVIRIYSEEVFKDLGSWGVVPKKSKILKFPKIENDKLMWHYIRGYFDGDGSIFYEKRSNQLHTKITCASPFFIKSFVDYLNKYNIKTYIASSGIDCGITGKESTRIFLSKMYDNATVYLERKYKKYQDYKYLYSLNK